MNFTVGNVILTRPQHSHAFSRLGLGLWKRITEIRWFFHNPGECQRDMLYIIAYYSLTSFKCAIENHGCIFSLRYWNGIRFKTGMVDSEWHQISCNERALFLIPYSTDLCSGLLSRLHIHHWTILNELKVKYAQINRHTLPTWLLKSSNKIQHIWPLKVSMFIVRGIYKGQIMHELRFYHVYFVLSKWH